MGIEEDAVFLQIQSPTIAESCKRVVTQFSVMIFNCSINNDDDERF